MESVCLVQLFLTLFAGMLFKAGLSNEVPTDEYQLYTWLLLVCNYGAIACGVLVVLLEAQVGRLLRSLCKCRGSKNKKGNAVADAESDCIGSKVAPKGSSTSSFDSDFQTSDSETEN